MAWYPNRLRERTLASRLSRLLANLIPGYNPWDYEGQVMAGIVVNDAKNYLKAEGGGWSHEVWSEDGMGEWLERWVYKWRERVKLVFNHKANLIFDKQRELLRDTEGIWRALPYRDELKELVVSALVEVGEICFTDLLAENLIRSELQAYKRRLRSEKAVLMQVLASPLKMVKSLLRKAKNLKYWRGHLVTFRVNEQILRGATGRIVDRIREAGYYAISQEGL